MKRLIIALLLLSALSFTLLGQSSTNSQGSFAVRGVFSNFQWPITDFLTDEDFTGGLEFEYYHDVSENFGVSIPLRIQKFNLPTDNRGNFSSDGGFGADFLLHLLPLGRKGFVYPDIYAGVGAGIVLDGDNFGSAPLGVTLNWRMSPNLYFTTKGEGRFGFSDLRDHLQLGAGFLVHFGPPPPPPPPPVTDTDGDGINDPEDLCPTVAGVLELNGCPDTDGDGITDGDDECPTEAGDRANNGCPDTDGDGILDKDDECPTEAGIPEKNGCPERDSDGDGVNDDDDLCPNEAGVAALNGCPDKDNDGIADAADDCPDDAGPAANKGCPDTDGDGVLDKDDSCVTTPGPKENRGCPVIKKEDRDIIEFAIQNVNFQTGSATLLPSSRRVLDKIVDILQRYPDYKVRIGGHTDSQGSDESNLDLSERRAKSTFDYIISRGIANERLSYKGYGELQPIATNDTREGRLQNRRVEFDLYIE